MDDRNESMKSDSQEDGSDRSDLLVHLRWPLTVLVLVAMALFAAYSAYRLSLDRAGRAGRAVTEAAASVADRATDIARTMLTGDVTERFVAAIPIIEGAGSGRLELASARSVETFTKTDERRVLWDMVPLGTSVSEIRVPVTYRYHLSLDETWQVEIENGVAIVRAPAVRATLPVAIHTDGLEKRVDDGWLRFDGDEQLADLEKTITPRLTGYARDQRHVDLVRAEARRTVAAFVRGWLLREDQWGAERVRAIKVLFADETLDPLEIGASVVLRESLD